MQLFLSFNSADRTSVIAVQKLLQARGITTFLDRDNLVSGLAWPQALEQALRAVDGVAVFIGCELGGWQKRETTLDEAIGGGKDTLPDENALCDSSRSMMFPWNGAAQNASPAPLLTLSDSRSNLGP